MNLSYETDRLILKILKPDSAQKVLKFYLDNKELFEEYEAMRPDNFYTAKYQKSMLSCEYNMAAKSSTIRFWVFHKENLNEIIGTVCFRDIKKSIYDSCELGYKFDARYWHRGYATEALIEGINIMFDDFDLHRIEAYVMPKNTSSIKLLESLYFQREGTLHKNAKIRGNWEDHILYGLVQT